MSAVEKCRRCGATAPVIQAGSCGGCGYSQTYSPAEIRPNETVASRPSNAEYRRRVVERAYRNPPTGQARKLHDAMAHAVGLDKDLTV